jgi:outer membrane murein-binding lipoprotein Lpp
VKFLAVNTGYETLDVLTSKVATMEAEVTSMKKEVAAANKAASSAMNKADEGKKTFDLLVKRVAKIEK